MSFALKLGFCPSESDFSISIPKDEWREIRNKAYGSTQKQCIGCGHSPENPLELYIHIEECIMGDKDSAVIKLLCPACHSIRHFDIAAEKGWVILVNSVHSQERLVEICREGKHILMSEIESKNIIILKNKNVKEYASELKLGKQRLNDKIKVVFGKNFDWTPKKPQNTYMETIQPKI